MAAHFVTVTEKLRSSFCLMHNVYIRYNGLQFCLKLNNLRPSFQIFMITLLNNLNKIFDIIKKEKLATFCLQQTN